MEDDVRRSLFDPYASLALVLAHRPPEATPVAAVVSDAVWGDVVRLLRWAAADAHGIPVRRYGLWWRLATGCADLLRRLPALGDEIEEPYADAELADDDLPRRPADRIALAADRLAVLLRDPDPVPLRLLAARVDALGAAAVSALADRSVGLLG
jgi:hypothetical protein